MKVSNLVTKAGGFILKDVPTLAKQLKQIEQTSKVTTPLSWFNLPHDHPLTVFLINNQLVNVHRHMYTRHLSMQLNPHGLSVRGLSRT